jgi:hypothetical protein
VNFTNQKTEYKQKVLTDQTKQKQTENKTLLTTSRKENTNVKPVCSHLNSTSDKSPRSPCS